MQNIKIYYGTLQFSKDVTEQCRAKFQVNEQVIIIPKGDHLRSLFLGDPQYGFLKSIFITDDKNITHTYSHLRTLYINAQYTGDKNETLVYTDLDDIPDALRLLDVDEKLNAFHQQLHLVHGSFREELPEQKIAARFLTGLETVLEIGGNVGRNSLIIAAFQRQMKRSALVVLESDPESAKKLQENRDANQFNFVIEPSALSKKPLIQKGWQCIESAEILDGYQKVNTITIDALRLKYPQFTFDTLVLDCEGAFYYILKDMPEILQGIHLILVENDYHDIEHKNYIDQVLIAYQFQVEYSEPGGFGPCTSCFYQVWRKQMLV